MEFCGSGQPENRILESRWFEHRKENLTLRFKKKKRTVSVRDRANEAGWGMGRATTPFHPKQKRV